MRAGWFRKHGYKVADKNGMIQLLWKPFNENATPPKFIRPKKKPVKGEGKVNVTIFRNGWCPKYNIACERTLRACGEFPGKIDLQEFETTDKEVVREWGITDGLYIDSKEVWTGPAPTYEKLRKRIEKRVRKLF